MQVLEVTASPRTLVRPGGRRRLRPNFRESCLPRAYALLPSGPKREFLERIPKAS